ncbi:hypothetical protein [Sporosarcina sp. HYO08]|uniref:hypothetical protein n=1 Tax=Sporosarcina sp. HYO08 TaxID=1759557 RepID=UPI00079C429C|nr:hypothetical protein [Sporosarcina sp. HYO08]KXH82069.1 hypothetical protein AU377_07405 [Sporosarcina sp. HYO08]
MFSKPVYLHEQYTHNGEIINVRTHVYTDKSYTSFTYNGQEVSESFDNYSGSSWYTIAKRNCMLIDKLGNDYKTYAEYRNEVKKIEDKYIIVDNNVYGYFHDDSANGSRKPVYHIFSIEMEDEEVISESTNLNNDLFKHFNKKDIFSKFKSRVRTYYKNNEVLPSVKRLERDETDKYRKMKEWLVENADC